MELSAYTVTGDIADILRRMANNQTVSHSEMERAKRALGSSSVPEPEPDEATKVWREMLVNAFEAVNDAPMVEAHRKGALPLSAWDEAQISRLRKVLAEKDAERDKWENSANYAHRQLGNATAELAALRAENERLKKLDVEYGQVETAIIFADPDFDGDSDHATCGERLIASVKRLASKAAERNPAGPGPWPGDPDHRETMPVDTAPVVEVTQADRLRLQSWWSSKGMAIEVAERLVSQRADEDTFLQLLARHRTEAEARGRRAALEEAACVMDNLCFFTPIDELREMTKQEMSVRACREGAAAIRDLMTEPKP